MSDKKTKKKKGISRRSFFGLAGAAGATISVGVGEKYLHKLIPYVNPPQNIEPGEWSFYTTTCRECPAGCGLMLWYRDGRVTKAEGNPLHPVNRGKICIRGQASVQGEYHPERLKSVLKRDNGDHIESNWNEAYAGIKKKLASSRKVIFISDIQTGSLNEVFDQFAKKNNTRVLYHEVFNYNAIKAAAQDVYGKAIIPRFRLEKADLILSFRAPFLETWLSPVEYAVDFGKLHSMDDNTPAPFIYFGPAENMTSVNADYHIITEPGTEAGIIYQIAEELYKNGNIGEEFKDRLEFAEDHLLKKDEDMIRKVAEMITRSENPVILAGNAFENNEDERNMVKASFILNDMLNAGQDYIIPEEYHALSHTTAKEELEEELRGTGIDDIVVIHQANPIYDSPWLRKYMQNAGMIVYAGSFDNETAAMADWILPLSYYLEEWGDFEARKGLISLNQPVMRPLYEATKSSGEIFLELAGNNRTTFKEMVRENWIKWSGNTGETDKQSFFEDHLRKGYIEGSSFNTLSEFKKEDTGLKISNIPRSANEVYLHINPSIFFYDGKLANRSWLQEIPHPVSNIAWGSWLDIHPGKAEELNIEENDLVSVTNSAQHLELPVRFNESVGFNLIAIETGQGHTNMGEIASGIGANAFELASFTGKQNVVKITKLNKNEEPVYVHPTKDQHNRKLLRTVNIEELQSEQYHSDEITMPAPSGYRKDRDLYPPHSHSDHRWVMVIDLQKCIGCKACEAACYAENNIPVTGRENVKEGREMSWLKIVPYKLDNGRYSYLPVPCQHCDAAPCEPVCPVFAAVHSEEGLNSQIYNRCIGTRYCSNNCPYKVRRFNWSKVKYPSPTNIQLNPEVSVRERGVMEKCTFCVQRIRNAQHKALIENRKPEEDEIVPACAQTCPTGAIRFGDLMDPDSTVNQLIKDKRRYQLLHKLNTKPGVFYLKKVNLNIL